MLFAVAVVFDQIGVGDAVSAVDFCDAAGGVEDELDYFAGTTAGGGGGSRVHCERWMWRLWSGFVSVAFCYGVRRDRGGEVVGGKLR